MDGKCTPSLYRAGLILALLACGFPGLLNLGKAASAVETKASATSEPVILRLAHEAAIGHPTDLASRELADLVYTQSQGKVKLEILGNVRFVQESELINQVAAGELDLAVVSTGIPPSYNSALGLLDLPYLFSSANQAYQVWDGEPGEVVLKQFVNSGLVGICYWDYGSHLLTTSDRPVENLEDLKGLRIQVMPNPVNLEFFGFLHTKPTPLPWDEVIPAFEEGIIEAEENSVPMIYWNHLQKYQHYLILTQHCYSPYIVLTGPAMRRKLSDSDYQWVLELIRTERIKQRQLIQEQTTRYLKTLQDHGMKIITPDTKRLRELGREFSRNQLNRFNPQIANYFKGYLQ